MTQHWRKNFLLSPKTLLHFVIIYPDQTKAPAPSRCHLFTPPLPPLAAMVPLEERGKGLRLTKRRNEGANGRRGRKGGGCASGAQTRDQRLVAKKPLFFKSDFV